MTTRATQDPIVVSAPATSANLGSGFDAAGIALDWWDTLRVTRVDGTPGDFVLTAHGEESRTLPTTRENLLIDAIMRFAEVTGRKCPALSLELELGFPLGRGFGSSATGIALGLVAAQAVLGSDMSDTDMFELATKIEGHPDNVAPCLFGGATVCWTEAGRPQYHRVEVHPDLVGLALVAPKPMGTKAARQILPSSVPFAHATWTAGRAALLPLAIAGAFDLLLPATDDVLHQEVRLASWPEARQTLATLRAGGHAAFVSGAGPSLLILCTRDELGRAQREAQQACRGANGWRLRQVNLLRGTGARADASH